MISQGNQTLEISTVFSGPVEIIIFHFLSLCSFPFRFIQPFQSQEFPQS